MATHTDQELLETYNRDGSESAFRDLVERHINLVHSAAVRESRGNDSLAQDITQAVFTELAIRSDKLRGHPALAGWLYTCVRRMAANVRRAEDRRQRREQEAMTMSELLGQDTADPLWQQVRPVLDDVMHELNDADRTAVVLRFFEGQSLKQVGAALGLNENAARMRVERSLEKLRDLLARRGAKSTATTLAAALAVGAAMTAPSALAATVASGALTSAAAGGSTIFSLSKIMNITKFKVAAGSALLGIVSALLLLHAATRNQASPPKIEQAAQPVAASSTATEVSTSQKDTAVAASTNASVPTMALQIVETESGKPLANAKILLAYLRQDGRGEDVRATADATGKLNVKALASPFHYLNLFVTASGHVPKVTSFRATAGTPSAYTMKLERGATIGGVVVDEAGHPVANAKIEFDGPGNDSTREVNIQFGPDAVVHSGTDGRWSCDMIPKELEQIQVMVSHADYAETTTIVQPRSAEATNLTITLKAGFKVAGVVQDSSGNPVEGAKVREVRMNSEGEHSKKTDAAGQFVFKGMNAGTLLLSVQAKGFAPAVQTIEVASNVDLLRFQLGPGQLLRGCVVDEDGNPVTNAWAETLRTSIDKVEWSTWVNGEGRFTWDSAPVEAIRYSFEAEGYKRVYGTNLLADGTEHVIKLARTQPGKDDIQISGTVVDATTGKPVDGFRVLLGEAFEDWVPPLEFGTRGTDGKFSLVSHRGALRTNYFVQIEKEGYLPAVSATLPVKAGSQKLEFKLERGAGPSGVVLLPGGEAAANATVYLCIPGAGVTLEGNGHVQTGINTSTCTARTDEGGNFSLAPVPSPQGVIAVSEQGFAKVSMAELAANGRITLQPWGRIEGSLTLDSQPIANETVVAGGQECGYDELGRRFGLISFRVETKTDAAGKFIFEKVPPGECKVFRMEKSSREPRMAFGSRGTSVSVKAGVTSQVALGGAGRTVVGKAVLPGAKETMDWQGVRVDLSQKLVNDPGPFPRRHEFSSNEAYIDAVNRWQTTDRGRQTFGAFCESDGSFRLQAIPAGTYEMKIRLTEKPGLATREQFPGEDHEIASLAREITVTDEGSEAMDLGALELTPTSNQDRAQR